MVKVRTSALIGVLSEARHWGGWRGRLRVLHSHFVERPYRNRVDFVLAIGHLGARWYEMCGYLKNDFIHEDHSSIDDWITKHNRYATHEALESFRRGHAVHDTEIEASFFGSQAERKRWLRHRAWNRLPRLMRPFLYFFYRYILRGGFWTGGRLSYITSCRLFGFRS